MPNLKAAVVGVGHLGKHHARWYHNLDGVDLVGVFDIDTERAQSIADEHGVKVFKTLDEISSEVDLCSIVTSTSKHYEVGKLLLSHGVHCLIEKPIASTVEQAEELIAIAKDKGALLTVGHIERFNPAFQAVADLKLEPRFIEGHRLAAFNARGADVAVILDLMIHDIDLCLALNPNAKVEKVDASAVKVVSPTYDIANARITWDNGCVANLTASRISLNNMRKLRVFQESAYYSLDLAERKADFYSVDGSNVKLPSGTTDSQLKIPIGESGQSINYEKLEAGSVDQLSKELETFVSAVSGKGRLEVTAAEAFDALNIALQIDKMARDS